MTQVDEYGRDYAIPPQTELVARRGGITRNPIGLNVQLEAGDSGFVLFDVPVQGSSEADSPYHAISVPVSDANSWVRF